MSVNLVNQTDASLAPIAGATLYADAPVGSIQAYGGATAPWGWLLCQGQAVSRATYAELFGVIGTSFGAGDGSTTFNVPDLRGKFVEGLASGDTLGASKAAGLPNIKGQITGGAVCSLTGASGAISAGSVSSSMYNQSGTFQRYSLIFNAHNSNSIYSDDVSTVQPPAVCVNYIIKATTIALPSDFEDAVDDKLQFERVATNNSKIIIFENKDSNQIIIKSDAPSVSLTGVITEIDAITDSTNIPGHTIYVPAVVYNAAGTITYAAMVSIASTNGTIRVICGQLTTYGSYFLCCSGSDLINY